MKLEQEHLPSKMALNKLPPQSPLPEANWVLVFGSINRFTERNFAETIQHRADDQRRQVRIPDGRPGAVEPGIYRLVNPFSAAQFFLESFKNQDVSVNRRPNRNQEARDRR